MVRTPPSPDWVAYVVVFGTVAAMMFGKYLMARGDKNQTVSKNNKEKDIVDDKS